MNTKLKKGRYASRISRGSGVYIAAVLEYMIAEILELAGNAARDNKRRRINPRHIALAVRGDEELDKLLADVIIAEGGSHAPYPQSPRTVSWSCRCRCRQSPNEQDLDVEAPSVSQWSVRTEESVSQSTQRTERNDNDNDNDNACMTLMTYHTITSFLSSRSRAHYRPVMPCPQQTINPFPALNTLERGPPFPALNTLERGPPFPALNTLERGPPFPALNKQSTHSLTGGLKGGFPPYRGQRGRAPYIIVEMDLCDPHGAESAPLLGLW